MDSAASLVIPSASLVLPTATAHHRNALCQTIGDLKHAAAALSGVPADSLLIFQEGPLDSDERIDAGACYHLAVGRSPPPSSLCPQYASSGTTPHDMPLDSLLASFRALQERVERCQSAQVLGDAGADSARRHLNAALADTFDEEARVRSGLEKVELSARVASLEAALTRESRRLHLAEERVASLEQQLVEARRSAVASSTPAQPTPHVADDAQAAPPPPPTAAKAASPLPVVAIASASSVAEGDGLLARIRRERACDVDIPQALGAAVNALRGALHRSLVLLSEDLYREESHCVSELLQNADDNECTCTRALEL